jgi:hypothetical protein
VHHGLRAGGFKWGPGGGGGQAVFAHIPLPTFLININSHVILEVVLGRPPGSVVLLARPHKSFLHT